MGIAISRQSIFYMLRCMLLALVILLHAFTADVGAIETPAVTDVLVSPSSDSVRIFVYLSHPTKFTYHGDGPLSDLTLEIPGVRSEVPNGPIPVGREPVREILVTPASGDKPARVVVSFSSKAKWDVSSTTDGKRITIDIKPAQGESSTSAPAQTSTASSAVVDSTKPNGAVTSKPSGKVRDKRESAKPITPADALECSFKETELHDVIQAVAKLVGVNIVCDGSIQGKITISLNNITWEEGLGTALKSLGYSLRQDGNVYVVSKSAPENVPTVAVDGDKLTVSALQVDVKQLLAAISEKSGLNIVAAPAVDGKITVDLTGVPVEDGLYTMLSANGYSFRKMQDIYVVDKMEQGKSKPAMRPYKRTTAGKITIDFRDSELAEVLSELANQTGKNIVTYGQLNEKMTIRLVDVTIEEALKLVLAGTKYTFGHVGEAFIVGDATNLASPVAQMLTVTEIIPLKFIKAEECPKYLSAVVPAANIKPLKERNALLVVGTQDMIIRIKQEIELIDQEAPQVMIEAQVIELSSNTSVNLGLDYQGAKGQISAKLPGTGQAVFNYTASQAKNLIITLQALITDGKAKVLASPKVTTINGKEANISISQQRYFRTGYIPPVYPDNGNNNNQQPPPYYGYNPYGQVQSVEAGIILRIVPFVGASDEITVDIEPEVSNVTGTGPDGLPEVSRRKANTTVRVRNGETIVIGGLKQREQSKAVTRTPLLSSIPLIGEFFKSRTKNEREADLMILITPTLMTSEGHDDQDKSSQTPGKENLTDIEPVGKENPEKDR